jgi:2-polyprenyl-6-methoxyphenol hydroxylase-like FAD-dependent oxidoreductase
MSDHRSPVLIVGGGGAGLTASILLSQLGIESLLINARPSTSDLPKAHLLNQRAMEILRDAGVADTIYARGTPPENMRATAWYRLVRLKFGGLAIQIPTGSRPAPVRQPTSRRFASSRFSERKPKNSRREGFDSITSS